MTFVAVDQTRTYRAISIDRGEWWSAKCTDCREWVSKYDFTKEQALAIAERSGHHCAPRSTP